jgi:hypothetical protein
VFTVSASRDDEQHSPSSTAKTAITWTANENRQLFINSKCNLTNYVRKERPNTEVRSSADRGLPIAERGRSIQQHAELEIQALNEERS